MTRVLVTGGAGYVGSVSVDAFLAAGSRRRRPRRPVDRASGGRPGGRPARGRRLRRRRDGRRPCSPTRASRRSSTARRGRWSASRSRTPRRYYRDNVAGGVALLEAARAVGVERFVLLVDRRGLRRARRDPDPRGRAAPADQPVRRDEAGLRRRRWTWYGRAYGLRARLASLLQRRRRHGGARRGPRPGDPPHPGDPRARPRRAGR